MHVSPDFTKKEILHLDPELLSEALTLFYELVAWMDNDVFTDSPERAESVAGAEEALHLAHQTMRKIETNSVRWASHPLPPHGKR